MYICNSIRLGKYALVYRCEYTGIGHNMSNTIIYIVMSYLFSEFIFLSIIKQVGQVFHGVHRVDVIGAVTCICGICIVYSV